MKRMFVIAAVVLAAGSATAVAAISFAGATVQAERPAKVLGVMQGTATVTKVDRRTNRIDVRLIRNSQQMTYRTFLTPQVGRTYRAVLRYTCVRPMRAGQWQTQVRAVRPNGLAGPWSTSPVRLTTC